VHAPSRGRNFFDEMTTSITAFLEELNMKPFARISILGLLLVAAAPGRAAVFSASANCGNYGGGSYTANSTSASEGCSNSIDYPKSVVAGAEADAGGLHAGAQGDGHLLGQAGAGVRDNYLVSAGPNLAGATGTLVFTYNIHGVTSGPFAKGRVLVTVDDAAVYTDPAAAVAFLQYFDGGDLGVDSEGGLGIAINFDSPNDIETYLEVYSESGFIDFNSTVELVGIQAFNSAGKPVSATITGDGGFDYSALAASNAAALGLNAGAVPEPSTWAMLLIGFAGLGYAGYRRATPNQRLQPQPLKS
jgi:hypothetical protein